MENAMKTNNLTIMSPGYDEDALAFIYSVMEDILSHVEKPTSCYHYTSIGNLDKILSSGSMFSTGIRCLNDPSEHTYGYMRLHDAIYKLYKDDTLKDFPNTVEAYKDKLYFRSHGSEFEANPSDLYTISFCEQQDDLNQWVRYARECGVAIEIDCLPLTKKGRNVILCQKNTITNNEGVEEIEYVESNLAEPLRMIYEPADVDLFAKCIYKCMPIGVVNKDLIREKALRELLTCLLYFASFIKDKRYEKEEELRYSIYPIKTKTEAKKKMQEIVFTEDNHILKPHIPIYGCTSDMNVCGWPISSITVGPGSNQQAAFEALLYRLESGLTKTYNYPFGDVVRRRLSFYLSTLESFRQSEFKDNIITSEQLHAFLTPEDGVMPHLKYKENKDFVEVIGKTCSDANLSAIAYEIVDNLNNGKEEDVASSGRLDQFKLFSKKAYSLIREVEKHVYCTTRGTLLKKSTLPHVFPASN